MSARSNLFLLPALMGASLLVATGLPAFAQTVSEVAVAGGAPTRLAISLTGKSTATVHGEVRSAARTVCRNAVSNGDLASADRQWCERTTAVKALRRYAIIMAGARQTAEAPSTILLSLR